MKTRDSYHSALWPASDDGQFLNRWEAGGNIAFVHDVSDPIPPEFRSATVLYAEPAWRHGYPRFLQRAGAEGLRDFCGHLESVRSLIHSLAIPAYVIAGKEMLRYLSPDAVGDTTLHGSVCHVAIWNAPRLDAPDAGALARAVIAPGACVLDCFCGYGNTARIATQQGARFVCSDINGRCIRKLAINYMGYRP